MRSAGVDVSAIIRAGQMAVLPPQSPRQRLAPFLRRPDFLSQRSRRAPPTVAQAPQPETPRMPETRRGGSRQAPPAAPAGVAGRVRPSGLAVSTPEPAGAASRMGSGQADSPSARPSPPGPASRMGPGQ